MKTIEQAFHHTLRQACGVAPHQRVLVAVSGGLDSMVLLSLLHGMGQPLSVAHVNYGLRKPDADLDEALVQSFCDARGIPVVVERLVNFKGPNVQARAREARLAFFEQHRPNHDFLALAHHRDDVYESFFLHLLRGSGPEALLNPRLTDEWRIRPLLGFAKENLRAYAMEQDIPWREDASNAGMDYTRNRLRNQVFPALKEAIPEWQKGLDRTLENLDFFVRHPHYKDELKRRQEIRYGQPYLKLDGLATKDAAHYLVLWLQNEVLLPLPEMERWLNSQRGAQFTKAQVELELGPDGVYHLTNPTGGSQVNIREKGRQAIVLEGLLKGGFQGYVQTEIRVNPEHLTFPLEIRPWRKGDSFDPQGGRGQKLVSDYLTDLKLPRFVKDQTHVLLSGHEIVWLVGWRASARYSVEQNAEKAYLVALE